MRFDRVLLVTPSLPGHFFGGIRPPVGMGYLNEYLKTHGVVTDVLDMTMGHGKRNLLNRIREFRPGLIGYTVHTYQFGHAYALLEDVKKRFPSIASVVGGPHVSALRSEVLNQSQGIDYAIEGEGEKALYGLCSGDPLDDVPGLSFRSDGKAVQGRPRVYSPNLDEFPFPRYEQYHPERYAEIEIVTSRGCPYPCIFCSVPTIMGNRVRYRSVESVVEEIAYFAHRYGRRIFQFGDDNLLADKDRIYRLVDVLASRNLKGLTLRCGQGIRADFLDKDILAAMKRAGFRHIGIGVESGSDRVLKVIRKGESLEKIDRAIALACEMGFDVSLLFIVGTPGETVEDVERSIALAQKHPVMKAFFFNLVPFPATPIHDWVIRNNAQLAPLDELFNRRNELKLRSEPFFATQELSAAERVRLCKITNRVSADIRVKALERKLSVFGVLGVVAAQFARSNILERHILRNRILNRYLHLLVFRRRNGC